MNIYITGTTRGLGKELIPHFERKYMFNKVVGLNRPEYDLSRNVDDFIRNDFKVFVNNAHYGFAQTELLYKLFEANKDRKCLIINIGSVSADGDRKEVNEYAIQKKALDAACTQLQLVKSECRVIQVKPGRIDTDLVKHLESKKMDAFDLAKQIVWISELCWGNTYFKTFTVDNK